MEAEKDVPGLILNGSTLSPGVRVTGVSCAASDKANNKINEISKAGSILILGLP